MGNNETKSTMTNEEVSSNQELRSIVDPINETMY